MDPVNQVLSTEGEMSPKAYRRRSRVPGSQDQVTWRFLETDYKLFLAWWRGELNYGTRWFLIQLPSARGYDWHVARFGEKDYSASLVGHRSWEVKADLEIRERRFPDGMGGGGGGGGGGAAVIPISDFSLLGAPFFLDDFSNAAGIIHGNLTDTGQTWSRGAASASFDARYDGSGNMRQSLANPGFQASIQSTFAVTTEFQPPFYMLLEFPSFPSPNPPAGNSNQFFSFDVTLDNEASSFGFVVQYVKQIPDPFPFNQYVITTYLGDSNTPEIYIPSLYAATPHQILLIVKPSTYTIYIDGIHFKTSGFAGFDFLANVNAILKLSIADSASRPTFLSKVAVGPFDPPPVVPVTVFADHFDGATNLIVTSHTPDIFPSGFVWDTNGINASLKLDGSGNAIHSTTALGINSNIGFGTGVWTINLAGGYTAFFTCTMTAEDDDGGDAVFSIEKDSPVRHISIKIRNAAAGDTVIISGQGSSGSFSYSDSISIVVGTPITAKLVVLPNSSWSIYINDVLLRSSSAETGLNFVCDILGIVATVLNGSFGSTFNIQEVSLTTP